MRRFEILNVHGEVTGEGVEWSHAKPDGFRVDVMVRGHDGVWVDESYPTLLDCREAFNNTSDGIRLLDFPPAAHTSDGTPVYTLENPPPPEPVEEAESVTVEKGLTLGPTWGDIRIPVDFFGTTGPDVRIKPSEALVREAERINKESLRVLQQCALRGIAAELAECYPGAQRTTERTHPDRKPRAEREAGRKRMAMEVLSQPFAGRKERK